MVYNIPILSPPPQPLEKCTVMALSDQTGSPKQLKRCDSDNTNSDSKQAQARTLKRVDDDDALMRRASKSNAQAETETLAHNATQALGW